MHWISPGSASLLAVFKPFPLVSGRSSAYGDATAEGHPAGPGSVSSSTGAISTTTGHQEGDGSEGEGEGDGEADVHASNRSGPGRRRAGVFAGGACLGFG